MATWIVLVALCSTGLVNIKMSSDTRAFFDEASPSVQQLHAMEEKYAKTNNIFVVFRRSRDTIAETEVLRDILGFHDALWTVPYATRVDSLVNYKHVQGTDVDFSAEDLINPNAIASGELTENLLRHIANQDPTVFGRLVSPDLQTIGFNINVSLPEGDATGAIVKSIDEVRHLAAQLAGKHAEYETFVSGTLPLMATFAEAAKRDMLMLIPMALLLSSVIVIVALRSIRFAMGLLTCTTVTALVTTGIWASAGHVFNTATAVAPIIIMVLCIAAGLHIVVAIRSSTATDSKQRIEDGLRATIRPSLLALGTTLLSFLAFNFADAPPLQSLGNIVCTGLLIGYASLYTLMPAVAQLIGLPSTTTPQGNRDRPQSYIARHQGMLATLCLILVAIATPGITKLRLDDDFLTYFDRSFEYRRAMEFTQRHLTGQNRVQIDLPHPNGEVTDPDYVTAAIELQRWLRAHPNVNTTAGYVDALSQVARSMPERQGALPDTQAGIAEYVFLYELSLAPGESLADIISVDRTSSRIILTTTGLTSQGLRAFANEVNGWLEEQGYFTNAVVFDLSLLFASLSTDNVKSMLIATLISVSLIAIAVGVILRNARYGFACLIVSLVPLVTGFGIWGWTVGEIGLPGAVIVALTIGVLIDDAVHFLHKYRSVVDKMGHNLAVEHAVRTAGQAMFYTTCALLCGFSLLYFSGFLINSQLGVFTCLVFALALIFCLGLLPRLIQSRGSARNSDAAVS